MKQTKKINHTFVICAYKESPYLEECIQSVINQSVRGKVFIATSTDNDYIRQIADKYGLEVKVANHESDIARDWNFALESADTKYVTIAHQDDIYEKSYVSNVLRELENDDSSLICCTDYYEIRNGEKVKKNGNLIIKRILCSPLCIRPLRSTSFGKRFPIAFGNGICCPSVTYAKDRLELPVFEEGMLSNLDWQTWERISKQKGGFCYSHKLLMGHRIHEGSTTTEIIEDNSRGQEDYEMFRKFWPALIAKLICKLYSNSERSNKV